jgi:ectoine hydroxylase-related dioxygenase (phytanoyl-CoA dioxygenase family)
MQKVSKISLKDRLIKNHKNHIKNLSENGYTLITDFLNKDECKNLINHLEALKVQEFNTNELGGQYSGHGFFEQRLTCKSNLIFNIILNKSLHKIFKGFFLDSPFRIISTRLYRITGGFRYSFHTDNKKEGEKTNTKGLACLIYLNDTDDGALQVYSGSHLTSHEIKSNNVKSDFLDNRYGSDNRKFIKAKAGSLVICDIRTFHGSRQENTRLRSYRLWFQVHDNLDIGEKLLIDPSFINQDLKKNEMLFLGFGLPNIKKAYPLTSSKTSPTLVFLKNLKSLIISMPDLFLKRFKSNFLKYFRTH